MQGKYESRFLPEQKLKLKAHASISLTKKYKIFLNMEFR
jgi:hypothetical protein